MANSSLTHIWLEAPLFDVTLAMLPDNVTVLRAQPDSQPVYANAKPAQAIVASSALRYNAEMFQMMPNLRMIARTGIGVDNVDIQAAADRGIVVCNTPDGPSESTAEHTVAMLLALAKRLKQGNANLAAGNFGPRKGVLIGTEVQGKTVGLVGLGRIGRRVAQICRLAFDMRIIAYDPYIQPEQAAEWGVTLADLDSVIAQADFLSLHIPATPETRGLMNQARIAQMKDGAYLLNMARGPLIESDALLAALDSGKLAGAGLDVFDPEPPTENSPLRNHPNIIATPHTASLTLDGRLRMERMAIERLLAFFRGEEPADRVVG